MMPVQSLFDTQMYNNIEEFNKFEVEKFQNYVMKNYVEKGNPFDPCLQMIIDKLNDFYKEEFKFNRKFIKFNKSTGNLIVQRYTK